MNAEDIDLYLKYLKFKKKNPVRWVLFFILFGLALTIWSAVRFPGSPDAWTTIGIYVMIGALATTLIHLTIAIFTLPQDDLMKIIERQIARDPDALRYVSTH